MNAKDQFRIKMKGWRDGASCRPMSIELMVEEFPCYEAGYIQGQKDSRAVQDRYAKELGVTNNVVVAL